ncbi:MAG: hypothetical protein IPP44_14770 [Ideonella sp.]|nr:hypothetical protein [Ideonella sp.]
MNRSGFAGLLKSPRGTAGSAGLGALSTHRAVHPQEPGDITALHLALERECGPAEGERSLSLAEVFEDILVPIGKPRVAELSAGHCEPNLALPLGVEVWLDADAPRIEFLESASAC